MVSLRAPHGCECVEALSGPVEARSGFRDFRFDFTLRFVF